MLAAVMSSASTTRSDKPRRRTSGRLLALTGSSPHAKEGKRTDPIVDRAGACDGRR
jgi:hypothetical protein